MITIKTFYNDKYLILYGNYNRIIIYDLILNK